MKFTFDGYGINDAENEYKSRVATLTNSYRNSEVGNLLAATPELLKALMVYQQTSPAKRAATELHTAWYEQMTSAIKAATS